MEWIAGIVVFIILIIILINVILLTLEYIAEPDDVAYSDFLPGPPGTFKHGNI